MYEFFLISMLSFYSKNNLFNVERMFEVAAVGTTEIFLDISEMLCCFSGDVTDPNS